MSTNNESFVAKTMTHSTVLLGVFQLVLLILYATVGGDELVADGHERSDQPDIQGTGFQGYTFFIGILIMMFIGFGYLMTFMKWYGLGAVGFTMLVTVMGIQWAVFTESFFLQAVSGSKDWHKVDINMYCLIDALYAVASVLITFGGLIGKITPLQLIVIAIIEVVLWSFNYEVLMLKVAGLTDVGGTYIDHMFGAYFGLSVAYMLGKPKTTPQMGNVADIFSLIGTLFLWIYWPSFIAGAAVADSHHQERALIHTILALSSSTVATFFANCALLPAHDKKFRPVDIQNASLAGGIAIGSIATLDTGPFCAIMVGVAAGLLSTIGYHRIQPYLENTWNLHDTCGIHNLHAMPSVLGAVVSVVVAAALPNDHSYVPPFLDEKKQQWICQLAAIPICLTFAIVTGLITGKFLTWLQPQEGDHVSAFHDAEWWEVAGDYDATSMGKSVEMGDASAFSSEGKGKDNEA